jgi:hypothetical protein
MECFRVESMRTYIFRGKKMERRKELRKKRDERKESGNKIGFLRRRRVFPLSPFEFLTPTFSLSALLCASKPEKETFSHTKNFIYKSIKCNAISNTKSNKQLKKYE